MWGLTEYSGQTVLFPKERDEAGNGLEDEGPCRPPSPPFFFCSSSESLFCSCSFPLQLFQIPLMSHHQSLAKPASQMFAFTTLSAWFLLFHYSYHWPETWKHGKGKKGLFFFSSRISSAQVLVQHVWGRKAVGISMAVFGFITKVQLNQMCHKSLCTANLCPATAVGLLPWHCYLLLDRRGANIYYLLSALIPLQISNDSKV